MTLHVAILFEYPTLNGGERSMLSVLGRLRERPELRFTALAPPQGMLADALRDLGIPQVPLDVRAAAAPSSDQTVVASSTTDRTRIGSAIARCCELLNPDLLHANSLSMCRVTGALRPMFPAGLRCTGHVRDIVRLSPAAVRDVNSLDAIVAVSQATRDFHVRQGLDPNRAVVIRNGVDPDTFRCRDAVDGQTKEHRLAEAGLAQLPAGAFVVLAAGQIGLRKGQLDLARAVVQLQTAEPVRNLHLVLAGERYSTKAESLQYEQEIIRQFVDADLRDRLHLPGYVADIRQLMGVADLLVHSARQEPFGRVLLEAAACELPIVATAVGGTAELLRPEVDAILIAPAQPAALTAAIRRVMDEPASCRQRASAARARVAAEFTVLRAANSLAGLWISSR